MRLAKGWMNILSDEFENLYIKRLETFLAKEYRERIIYPKKDNIFEPLI